MSQLPPMGGHAGPLECGRLLRFPDPTSRCPNEAQHHVMWTEDGDNGLVCDDHKTEAVRRWKPMAIHRYEMACSMPGALFVHAENRCIVDEDWLGVRERQPRRDRPIRGSGSVSERRVAYYEGTTPDGRTVKNDAPFLHVGYGRLNFQVQRRIEFDAPEGPQVIYMGIWT